MASVALIIVGVVVIAFGLLGGPEWVIIGFGVVALVAGIVLQVVQRRAPR